MTYFIAASLPEGHPAKEEVVRILRKFKIRFDGSTNPERVKNFIDLQSVASSAAVTPRENAIGKATKPIRAVYRIGFPSTSAASASTSREVLERAPVEQMERFGQSPPMATDGNECFDQEDDDEDDPLQHILKVCNKRAEQIEQQRSLGKVMVAEERRLPMNGYAPAEVKQEEGIADVIEGETKPPVLNQEEIEREDEPLVVKEEEPEAEDDVMDVPPEEAPQLTKVSTASGLPPRRLVSRRRGYFRPDDDAPPKLDSVLRPPKLSSAIRKPSPPPVVRKPVASSASKTTSDFIYRCLLCKQRFSSTDDLGEHQRIHEFERQRQKQWATRDYQFIPAKQPNQKMWKRFEAPSSESPTSSASFTNVFCSKCEERFHSTAELAEHQKTSHQGPKRPKIED